MLLPEAVMPTCLMVRLALPPRNLVETKAGPVRRNMGSMEKEGGLCLNKTGAFKYALTPWDTMDAKTWLRKMWGVPCLSHVLIKVKWEGKWITMESTQKCLSQNWGGGRHRQFQVLFRCCFPDVACLHLSWALTSYHVVWGLWEGKWWAPNVLWIPPAAIPAHWPC